MQFDVKTNWARPFLHSILFLSCCFVNGALQEDLMLKLVDPPGGTPLIRLRSPRAHLHSILLKWKRCHSKALQAGEHLQLPVQNLYCTANSSTEKTKPLLGGISPGTPAAP